MREGVYIRPPASAAHARLLKRTPAHSVNADSLEQNRCQVGVQDQWNFTLVNKGCMPVAFELFPLTAIGHERKLTAY